MMLGLFTFRISKWKNIYAMVNKACYIFMRKCMDGYDVTNGSHSIILN